LIRAAASPALPLPAAERAVFIAICRHLDVAGTCWPSAATLAAEAGVSERRARQAVRRLESVGLIRVFFVRGRTLCFEVLADAVDHYAAGKATLRTAADSAEVAPRQAVTPEAVIPTPAEFAPTPAEFAPTPAEFASSAAESADEVVALGTSFRERGCADAQHAPTTTERDEAERALAEAEQTLPEWCRTSLALAKAAYERRRDPALLTALLRRLEAEAAAGAVPP